MFRSNTQTTYGSVSKVFHWLTALLILTAFPLGILANGAPFATGEEIVQKAWLFSLHKAVGVTIFFTALARILWAISQKKPAGLHSDNKLETFAAEAVHWRLYISMLMVPLSGWLHHAASVGFAPTLGALSSQALGADFFDATATRQPVSPPILRRLATHTPPQAP